MLFRSKTKKSGPSSPKPVLSADVTAAPTDRATGDALVHVSQHHLLGLKAQAEKLQLRAVRVSNCTGGAHLSRFRGRGMEFDETRLYQPGDEIRSIDWRVTARSGRPHTKLFRDERERSVLIWVDYRSPMYFATRGRFKSVLASQAAATLAWSARHQGDKLGALLFSEQGHRELRPGSGDSAVLNLIKLLADFSRRPPAASSPTLRESAIGNALSRFRRVNRPGSLLFLLSDFRELDRDAARHLAALARHNDLVLLRLHDPLEQQLPPDDWYRLSDGRRFTAFDGTEQRLRHRYQQRFDARQHELEALCRRHRIHLLDCATDQNLYEVLRLGVGRRAK